MRPALNGGPDFLGVKMSKFHISYWQGPPAEYALQEERIKEIADAGMTIANVWADFNDVKKMAPLFEKYGMTMNVFDHRMWGIWNQDEGWQDKLRRLAKDYKDIPNLNCFFLKDEPIPEQFQKLRDMKDIISEVDSEHKCLVNLLPVPAREYSVEVYSKYIDDFIEVFEPDMLSYDHYNLMFKEVEEYGEEKEAIVSNENRKTNGWLGKKFIKYNRGQFMDNLEIIRDRAHRHNIPWKIIILVTEHWDFRYLTEAELRWGAFSSLCYGPAEIDWFTYWTPGGRAEGWDHHNAMIELNGEKNTHYYMVQRINKELALMGAEIVDAKSTEVLHIGNEPEDVLLRYFTGSYGPLKALNASALVVGFFDNDCIMFSNKDMENAQTINFACDREVYLFNKYNGGYTLMQQNEAGLYELKMSAGDGELIKIGK